MIVHRKRSAVMVMIKTIVAMTTMTIMVIIMVTIMVIMIIDQDHDDDDHDDGDHDDDDHDAGDHDDYMNLNLNLGFWRDDPIVGRIETNISGFPSSASAPTMIMEEEKEENNIEEDKNKEKCQELLKGLFLIGQAAHN